MEHADFVREIRTQSEALRAAAVAAGPDAPTPTCPGWDVRRLVDHIARVHAWVAENVATGDPENPRPAPTPPGEWSTLLGWWDDYRGRMLDTLAASDPTAPAWVFSPVATPEVGFWARRQAHEAAIHRLDAEHALAVAEGGPRSEPDVAFPAEFAADGVDELLVRILPSHVTTWAQSRLRGSVLFHAVDVGRAWLVRLEPEQFPQTTHHFEGLDADASVVGNADAVYRAAWGRPHHAVTRGDEALLLAARGR
ncbi:TIGR03083 family protein [Streptoalloteichus tenebrarius]|uniref:TIGR03083 family protein n=1 Tax=Streptoalloteichus tenebrarius (strain ATCC 17920 / DSM 40477 / JCM 4838 / CBS 697.72 / NBRC 16177 / NCIMB 11028 / NRRL B-12390 / A12253. 1 / ISP 5477) TaxID=1933 RepID=A0ABT1I1M9_STRSD|nr:maleylpyruvate isomerase N-terminal domain-containing protein [Streptoalloteichus tenebrarius]MCP2261690.1 TIGR03083 family protein [Streptoalloteichus tenebrarius]BFF02399.1 maleylpyruvate isomerase family mycothiol-dependent enzyme [Streptoalloteichus tenebrarius]